MCEHGEVVRVGQSGLSMLFCSESRPSNANAHSNGYQRCFSDEHLFNDENNQTDFSEDPDYVTGSVDGPFDEHQP